LETSISAKPCTGTLTGLTKLLRDVWVKLGKEADCRLEVEIDGLAIFAIAWLAMSNTPFLKVLTQTP